MQYGTKAAALRRREEDAWLRRHRVLAYGSETGRPILHAYPVRRAGSVDWRATATQPWALLAYAGLLGLGWVAAYLVGLVG